MKDTFIHKMVRWYKRPNKNYFADLIESLIVILPVVFLIKTFIFGLVPSSNLFYGNNHACRRTIFCR